MYIYDLYLVKEEKIVNGKFKKIRDHIDCTLEHDKSMFIRVYAYTIRDTKRVCTFAWHSVAT